MDTGTKVSGIGHGLLILWALVGGLFTSGKPPEPETVDVSVISAAEFAALSPSAAIPEALTEVPRPNAPETDTAPSVSPRPEAAPERPETIAAPPPDPETAPEQPAPLAPEAEVDAAAPELIEPPTPPTGAGVEAPPEAEPTPQEAPRVAPTPAPAPPPDAAIAEQLTPSTTPDAPAAEVQETEPEAAPEEATTEIVTEAERPAGPLSSSPRPVLRPPPPVAEATPEPEPEPADDPLAAAVAGAVAEAIAGEAPPALASGPPLTEGERDTLRVSVQQCWNVGSLSSAALATTVVVGVEMFETGRPNIDSIRMISYDGGDETAARQAYEAARRAIIRCGANGYDLPPEKFAQWRDIEMTFNPERMRIR